MVQFLLSPLFLSDRFGALDHHDVKMMGLVWEGGETQERETQNLHLLKALAV